MNENQGHQSYMVVNVVPRCEVTLKIFVLAKLINHQKKRDKNKTKPKKLIDKGDRDIQES